MHLVEWSVSTGRATQISVPLWHQSSSRQTPVTTHQSPVTHQSPAAPPTAGVKRQMFDRAGGVAGATTKPSHVSVRSRFGFFASPFDIRDRATAGLAGRDSPSSSSACTRVSGNYTLHLTHDASSRAGKVEVLGSSSSLAPGHGREEYRKARAIELRL